MSGKKSPQGCGLFLKKFIKNHLTKFKICCIFAKSKPYK